MCISSADFENHDHFFARHEKKILLKCFSCDSLPGTVVVTVVVGLVATIKCRYVPRFSCVAGDMYRYCSCFMQIIVKTISESR